MKGEQSYRLGENLNWNSSIKI